MMNTLQNIQFQAIEGKLDSDLRWGPRSVSKSNNYRNKHLIDGQVHTDVQEQTSNRCKGTHTYVQVHTQMYRNTSRYTYTHRCTGTHTYTGTHKHLPVSPSRMKFSAIHCCSWRRRCSSSLACKSSLSFCCVEWKYLYRKWSCLRT